MRVLTPKDLALAIGVSESSLKRWADDGLVPVSRTAGGHRRIALADAIRFVRQQNVPLVRPDLLGLPELEAAGATTASSSASDLDTLVDLLVAGRGKEARGLLLAKYLNGESLPALFDDLIQPAMERIGDFWRHDTEGIFVEHRATDICVQAVNQLRTFLDPPDGAPIAIGGAPSGDPYILPALCAATVLAGEGFHVINIGPDAPWDTYRAAVRRHHPALLWLSFSSAELDVSLDAPFAAFVRELRAANIAVIIGGRQRPPKRAEAELDLQIGGTMSELAAFCRGVVTARSAPAP